MEYNNETILRIDGLSLDFETEEDTVHALSDINIELHKGETLGLVGESGCGKSTVAKAVMRLLASNARVKSGTIAFKGEDLLTKSKEDMRKIRGNDITLVFQDPMTALNPVMKIGNQIVDVIRSHEKISKKDAKERVYELLEMVGIDRDRFRSYPHEFSGGMRQRVVIAIALACNPELLIADEPTTALDVTIQAEILDLINDIQKQKQMAMLLISHDLGIIAETCDHVGVLYAGQIVEYGTIRQVFEDTKHPYTTGLFGAIPDIEDDTPRLRPIPGGIADASDLPEGCYFASRCEFATDECLKGAIPLTCLPDGHQVRCIKCGKTV